MAGHGLAVICAMTAFVLSANVQAGDGAIRPGAYDIVAVTYMPNLEEMRHIRTRESRCVASGAPAAAFPVLRQQALAGCALGDERRKDGRLWYALLCKTDLVATGTARLDVTAERIVGVLWIKMGGKNMTFSQRVDATWRASCDDIEHPADRLEESPARSLGDRL